MIPFLVADRPISLSIIKGVSLPPGAQIGVLTQAVTTTARFKRLFRSYPYDTDVVYANGQPSDRTISNRTIKMVDSGIFGKNGCHLKYAELFSEYETMGADYGIIIDAMRDSKATVRSAQEALAEYKKCERHFTLVGVAQGETADEYFSCYEQLKELGYEHIAVGGLLQKRDNTARFVFVRCRQLMEAVLRGIRRHFNPEWLFALGVLHPSRVELFRDVGVWGSDYKGWIFNYEKKDTVVDLIRTGNVGTSCRIAARNLEIGHIQSLTEQELRFFLTRSCIERRVMDQLHGRRLLVVACSARKLRKQGPAKAWNVYDGVAYRLMKKLQREGHFPSDVDILILSAKYGLIPPDHRISFYEQSMDENRVNELATSVSKTLKLKLSTNPYREVLLWMGQQYLQALKPFKRWRSADFTIRMARGRVGEKLRILKKWLKG